MGNVVKMSDYTTKYRIIDFLDPNFKECSKELQKQYPVLKYLCKESKFNKLKIENNKVTGKIQSIFDLPEPYYDYMCCDMFNEFIQIYLDTNQYENSTKPDDCIKLRVDAYDKTEKYMIEYYFLVSKYFMDRLSERMRSW